MKKENTKNEMSKNLKNDVATIHGVTVQYVNMCLRGDRNNPSIVATYEMLQYGQDKLIDAVKRVKKQTDQKKAPAVYIRGSFPPQA